jgi:subtilisin family serine protease
VAPGYGIWSAAMDGGDCSSDISNLIVGSSGTSMATPILAGNIVLIRQYFMEGYV